MSDLLSIERYVPHRGSMLLIDRLLEVGEEHAVAEVRVARDGMFVQPQGVPAWVAIEYMAQTVAAWAGWRAAQKGEPAKIGFLLGSRKLEALQPFFALGAVLRVEVQYELLGSNGLGMFSCQVLHNGQLAARARVSVFEPGDGAAYLRALESEEEKKHE